MMELWPGLVQLAAVWCAGEPAEEGAVCAERRCSPTHGVETTSLRGCASTPLTAGTETSGVQDCMSGTPIDHVNSTDVPVGRRGAPPQ